MLFLFVLFLIKDTSLFKNTISFVQSKEENGLTYDNATIADLVSKDTDGDGILDWEEPLYGLDPTKKETTPGIPDSTVISKLKAEQETSAETLNGGNSSGGTENLTQTDKFSRELFATVAVLNQNGEIDQTTIDKLSTSLTEQIENSAPRKVYAVSDLKITESNTKQTIQKYSNALDALYLKYPTKKGVTTILQEFTEDQENFNILLQLDPIINNTNKIIDASLKMQVPESLSLLHLDLINKFQIMVESVSDIKLFESDPLATISAISQYEKNALALVASAKNLTDTIKQKLNN
jgi:hypothetical protein